MNAVLPPANYTDPTSPPEPIACESKACETLLPWSWFDYAARCKARGTEPTRYRKPRWLKPPQLCKACTERTQFDEGARLFAERQDVAGIPEIFRGFDLGGADVHAGGDADSFRRQCLAGSTVGIVGGNSDAARFLRSWKPSDGWVYIHGINGSGKSSLSCAAANGILRHPYPPSLLVIAEESLDSQIKQASTDARFRRDRADRHDPVGVACKVAVLVYDDFATKSKRHAEQTPIDGWLRDQQERLIDHRYRNNLATILTSNVRLGDLRERFSGRLAGRVRERVGPRVYDLGNADWRAAC